MKKILTIATFSLVVASTYAQEKYKPVPGTITAEVGLNGGLFNSNFNLNSATNQNGAPIFKLRYFNSGSLGFRIGLAPASGKNETNTSTTNTFFGVTTTIDTKTTSKRSNFDLSLGVEKHLTGSSRLSTYIGADLLIGFGGASYDYSQVTATTGSPTTTTTKKVTGATDAAGNNAARSYFGIRLLSGADYYIARKLYLGVEFGLNIVSGKDKKVTITDNNNGTVTITNVPSYSKSFNIEPRLIGGVRIGYQF